MVVVLEWTQRRGCGPRYTGSNPVDHPKYREVAFARKERITDLVDPGFNSYPRTDAGRLCPGILSVVRGHPSRPNLIEKEMLMLYEFECKKCGKKFEELRKLDENSNTSTCPECKGEAKKVMSTFGFKINGFASINGYSHANK